MAVTAVAIAMASNEIRMADNVLLAWSEVRPT